MADVNGIRQAVEDLANKINTLRSVIQTLREGQIVQSTLDEIADRIEGLSTELDEIIADAKGETGGGGLEGGTGSGGETGGQGGEQGGNQPQAQPARK